MVTKIAGAILVERDGTLLLQRRDDNPMISYPNRISIFGGHVEQGEAFLDAVQREIHEETGLNLPPERFLPLVQINNSYPTGLTLLGAFYVIMGIDQADLKITEGALIAIKRDEIGRYFDQFVPTTCFVISKFIDDFKEKQM